METTSPHLPPEIEAAVAAHNGGPVSVTGQQGEHVVMSLAIFRDMMGVGNDEDFARSVAELRISFAQAEAGETLLLDEIRKNLADKYGA